VQTLEINKSEHKLTFFELRERLLKIEKTLVNLSKQPDRQQNPAEAKLKILKETYMKQLKVLKEYEESKPTVTTDDESKLPSLISKVGNKANIKLTKEYKSLGFTDEFISKLESDITDVLRDLGSEISSISSTKKDPTVIAVTVNFNVDSKATYTVSLDNSELVIKTDGVEGEMRLPVNVLPSGEIRYNSELLKKEYVKFMEREVMDFQDLDSKKDTAYDSDGTLLEIGDIVSVKGTTFKVSFDSEKELVYLESSNGKRVYGSDRKFKVLLEASTRITSEDEQGDETLQAILKKLEDMEKDSEGAYTKNYDDEEAGIVAEGVREVEVGDMVSISKEYGGDKGKVVDKRGSFIVLDNGQSYHESDVVRIRRDVREDLHIGHQDDEPGMLAQTAYELASYAADIHKMLKFYESLDQNVNFPNWWQSKVILARDYVSKAAHWLEYKTRELDQTQSYLNEKRKCKY
jgi:hypothetical protein